MKYSRIGAIFKPIDDKHGLHIRLFLKEIVEVLDDGPVLGKDVGLVTYHVNTNSITVGRFKEEGVSDLELIEHFMQIYRDDIFKNYLKDMGCSIHTKPVWSKQLKRHFA